MALKKIFNSTTIYKTKQLVGKVRDGNLYLYFLVLMATYFLFGGIVAFTAGNADIAWLRILLAITNASLFLTEWRAQKSEKAVHTIIEEAQHVISHMDSHIEELQTENLALGNFIKKLDRRVLRKAGIHLTVEEEPRQTN